MLTCAQHHHQHHHHTQPCHLRGRVDAACRWCRSRSTTFHYPINPAGARSESVMIHHHGHAQTCDNTVNGVLDCPVWFDFYNVSTFIHRTLGMDVTFMYMPLLGPNQQHGYPTKHQWFQSWESKGDVRARVQDCSSIPTSHAPTLLFTFASIFPFSCTPFFQPRTTGHAPLPRAKHRPTTVHRLPCPNHSYTPRTPVPRMPAYNAVLR